MIEKMQAILSRYQDIEDQLGQSADDYQTIVDLSKEKSDLEPIVKLANEYKELLSNLDETKLLAESMDLDMREMAKAELPEMQAHKDELEMKIKTLMVPKDPRDDRNVIIEIRAGTGGDEASIFVSDLLRMYLHYSDQHHYKTEIVSGNETGLGGYKEVTFSVKGKGAYSRFKFESGVHRVQRVPETEAQGRIHTSTVTVAVLAEVEDVEIKIPESDLNVDVFRSAGAGGQNVQKNQTAVRITHLPTGIVVACQDERSQLQNKLRAMGVLRARLYDLELQKRQDAQAASRKSQIGTGERSEKIRTYNYPQSRVTDHRVNVSSYNLSGVMAGYDLDTFITELQLADESERLANFEANG